MDKLPDNEKGVRKVDFWRTFWGLPPIEIERDPMPDISINTEASSIAMKSFVFNWPLQLMNSILLSSVYGGDHASELLSDHLDHLDLVFTNLPNDIYHQLTPVKAHYFTIQRQTFHLYFTGALSLAALVGSVKEDTNELYRQFMIAFDNWHTANAGKEFQSPKEKIVRIYFHYRRWKDREKKIVGRDLEWGMSLKKQVETERALVLSGLDDLLEVASIARRLYPQEWEESELERLMGYKLYKMYEARKYIIPTDQPLKNWEIYTPDEAIVIGYK